MLARLRRSGAMAVLVAAVGVVGSVSPATGVAFTPVGEVTEFGHGITAAGDPAAIALGADGDLWFTEFNGSRVGRITPAGKVTEFSRGITAASVPYGIAAGPDGNMWFTEIQSSRVGRITPNGKVTEFSRGITAASGPVGIAAGPDGNMWFAQQDTDQIGRITPAGKVTEFSTGITAGSFPSLIAAGPDGNLWFTEQDGDRIGRITPTGNVKEFSAGITAGGHPFGIAAGPDRNMWFTQPDGNQVGRITTGLSSVVGKVTEFSKGISKGSGPFGIAAGPDGNVWFTEGGTSHVARITRNGKVTEFSQGITAASGPLGIAVGPDGNLWFAEDASEQIGRITSGVPSAPRTVTASQRSKAAIVRWTAPNDPGAAAITRYLVSATPGGHGCVSTAALTCIVHGLRNATRYRFTVTARNVVGSGPPSSRSPAITAGTATAPRRLTVTFPHPGTATVGWRTPMSHGAPITSYQARWSANNGHTWSAWASTKLRRQITLTGRHNGKTYLVAVRARNHDGAGAVATLSFTQRR
jgi:virginiamycin B lyase